MKKFMTQNGSVDKTYVNGYHFGDRLLEDVFFECAIEEDKVKVLGVMKKSQSYFNQLDKEMWLKVAQEYVANNDIFYAPGNVEAWIEG